MPAHDEEKAKNFAKLPENDGNKGNLPALNLSKKTLLILVGSITLCVISFGLYSKFCEHFSLITMFKAWKASFQICNTMHGMHRQIIQTCISIEKNETACIIFQYLPKTPDPGDWLNGKVSIV